MTKLKVLASKPFWDDALVRAIRTFFQAALAFIGVNVVSVTGIDYVGAASIGAGAALISVAQSVIRVATEKLETEPFEPEAALAEAAAAVSEDEAILDTVVEQAIEDKKTE
jgi:hypothetical protein